MIENGLYSLPLAIKVFIISYIVLIGVGLLVALWVVLESPVMRGDNQDEQYPPEAIEEFKTARLYENLKKAHVHHLGHIFMVFSIAGIYAFTREKNNIKIQMIVWTTIVTIIHTLAFLIYSRLLLIIFGSAYAGLMAYMMLIIMIDCFRAGKSLSNP